MKTLPENIEQTMHLTSFERKEWTRFANTQSNGARDFIVKSLGEPGQAISINLYDKIAAGYRAWMLRGDRF